MEITDARGVRRGEDVGMAVAAAPGSSRSGRLSHRAGSARARAGNQIIREVVRGDTPGTLPFFCECGMDYCNRSVWLTLQEARDVIESGSLIIGAHVVRELEARLGRPRVPR